nr:hypothetical protein [Mycolicibacterium phocaicum]
MSDIATAAGVGRSTLHRVFLRAFRADPRRRPVRARDVQRRHRQSRAGLRSPARGAAPGGRIPAGPRTHRALRLQRADHRG